MSENNIYQFTVQRLSGEEVSLADYKDKVLLIVNTASECGFTPQLKELEQLRNNFTGKNFEILAFPSNDFGGQEPLNGAEIEDFCKKITAPITLYLIKCVLEGRMHILYINFFQTESRTNM